MTKESSIIKIAIASALSLCSAGIFSSAFAADNDVHSQGGPLGKTSIGSPISQSSTHTYQQQSLYQLQQQVVELQKELENLKTKPDYINSQLTKANTDNNAKHNRNIISGSRKSQSDGGKLKTTRNPVNDDTVQGLKDDGDPFNTSDLPAITTRGEITYLGAFSGNNALPIGQLPGNLFASSLLGQRNSFDDYSIFLGGYIETDAQVWNGSDITTRVDSTNYNGTFNADGQNIYLTNAKLFFVSNIGHYVTTEFQFEGNQDGDFNIGRAFVIFGNTDYSNWFVTAGKVDLSVGNYSGGGTVSSSITDMMFSPNTPANISIAYKTDSLNANVAVFGDNDRHANFSTGIFYNYAFTDNIIASTNVGYIYSIGNEDAFTDAADNTNHTIGEFNMDTNIAFSGIGEINGLLQFGSSWGTTTTKSRHYTVLAADGEGSNVYSGAWGVNASWGQILGGRNTNFNASYGQSYNADRIPMGISASDEYFGSTAYGVKQQYILSAQRAYFDDNVLFGPEYAYQHLYNGEHMNTVSLDISIYV